MALLLQPARVAVVNAEGRGTRLPSRCAASDEADDSRALLTSGSGGRDGGFQV